MKIAYYASLGNAKFQGVAHKLARQITAWNTMPHVQAKLFCRSITQWNLPNKVYALKGMPTLSYDAKLLQDMQTFAPDVVYVRDELCGPMLWAILRAFPQKVVLEVNADLLQELKLEGQQSFRRKLAWYYAKLTYALVKKRIKACTMVSEDYLHLFPALNAKHKKVFPNSIDLHNMPICKEHIHSVPLRPALIFVGTPGQAWHGVDLLKPLALALPDFDFHIVGYEANKETPANMIFHGYVTGEALQNLYKQCHVGMGSLALFRKNLYENSTLKSCEYVAHGLPIIIGYTETAFKGHALPWILQLHGEENMFDKLENIIKVQNFVLQNTRRIVTHTESAPYIDIKLCERKKILWLQDIFTKEI